MVTETTLVIDDGDHGPRTVVVFAERSTIDQWLKIGKPFYVDTPTSSTGKIRVDPRHVVRVGHDAAQG
jgi:hypothetical protein